MPRRLAPRRLRPGRPHSLLGQSPSPPGRASSLRGEPFPSKGNGSPRREHDADDRAEQETLNALSHGTSFHRLRGRPGRRDRQQPRRAARGDAPGSRGASPDAPLDLSAPRLGRDLGLPLPAPRAARPAGAARAAVRHRPRRGAADGLRSGERARQLGQHRSGFSVQCDLGGDGRALVPRGARPRNVRH
jgi:hypothetical protein